MALHWPFIVMTLLIYTKANKAEWCVLQDSPCFDSNLQVIFTYELRTISGESCPGIVQSCSFIHAAHNRKLTVSDTFSLKENSLVLTSGCHWLITLMYITMREVWYKNREHVEYFPYFLELCWTDQLKGNTNYSPYKQLQCMSCKHSVPSSSLARELCCMWCPSIVPCSPATIK